MHLIPSILIPDGTLKVCVLHLERISLSISILIDATIFSIREHTNGYAITENDWKTGASSAILLYEFLFHIIKRRARKSYLFN
jgi:hypothetical protein